MCEDALCSDARKIYRAAIDSVLPSGLVRSALNYDSHSRLLSVQGVKYPLNQNVKVIAFGKAVLGMVSTVEDLLGSHITEGVASVPVGSLETARQLFPECIPREGGRVRVYEGAAYNLPDAAAELAAREALSLAERAAAGELVIVLVSGGGSALLPCPVEGVSLQEKRQVIENLARAGATIHELNAFRKSLSQTKGGRLAEAAFPAKVVALVLSDVVGDPLDIIASGPTVPNRTNPADALQIISKYSLEDQLPQSVFSYLSEAGELHQSIVSIKDDNYSHVQNVIIGNNQFATAAAVSIAEQLGYNCLVWSHRIQGEARLLGEAYAKLAHTLLKRQRHNPTSRSAEPMKEEIMLALRAEPFGTLMKSIPDLCSDFTSLADQLTNTAPPLCLISAGEPIVNVRGSGTGGRNQELALSFALQIHKLEEEDSSGLEPASRSLQPKCLFLSIGTDGQDGPCDAAGAMVDSATLNQTRREGLDARQFLDSNDSYTFFSRVNGGRNLIQTGLTGTNVMDLQILLLR